MDNWIEKEMSIKEIKNLLNENDVEVDSPDGWVRVQKYVEKGLKNAFQLIVGDKMILSSAKHLYETNLGWIFADELNNTKHMILTKNGFEKFEIIPTTEKINVVDIAVDHPNHRYYTNGVSSHNTNLGKSLIMASLATDAVLSNKNVLYVTCEMSEDKISERIVANTFDVNINDLIALTRDKFHEKFESVKKQVGRKLVIKEYPPAAININHIRNLLKELEVQKKFKPDIVFVDYLGIMLPSRRNKGDNTYIEVKRISEELRALAVDCTIPFVSAVQTNRKGFGDSEIDLTDISDSIGTAATADVIIGVTQNDKMRAEGKFNWIILKNRYGQNKKKLAVNVDYLKMRVFNDDDSEVQNTASSISSADKKEKNKSAALGDVKNAIKKDTIDKFNKTIEFE